MLPPSLRAQLLLSPACLTLSAYGIWRMAYGSQRRAPASYARQMGCMDSLQWRGDASSVAERRVIVASEPQTMHRKCSSVGTTSSGSGASGSTASIRIVPLSIFHMT